MPYILRRTTLPPLAEVTAIPQIVIVDLTGPAIFVGEGDGIACLVGEFTKGPFLPTEPGSTATLLSLYGEKVQALFSQSSAGLQDGSGVAYNGNGLLELVGLTFKRLAISRVDTEAVTSDGGTTKGVLTITVTVAAADQAAGVTLRDLVIPAGTRFADQAISTATIVVATSGDITIPAGSTVSTNLVTATAPCFFVKAVEPIVSTAIAAIDTVIDTTVNNASTGTSITAVNNATALWPPGTGTTLTLRIESRYAAAIDRTAPGGSQISADIDFIWSARRSAVIRPLLVANANASSESGRGRTCAVNADPATANTSSAAVTARDAAIALATTESYPQPADRVDICFPHHKVVVPDLGSIKVLRGSACLMAATLSNFPHEANPGAQNEFIQAAVTELEDAFITFPLSKTDHTNLIAAGVCPLQKDRAAGWWFVDGRTAAPRLTWPTRYTIKRRRMADEVQDNVAIISAQFIKQPATPDRVSTFSSEVRTYLQNTLNDQRIVGFVVDEVSGNTPELTAAGIFVLITKVRILSTMDDIVLRTEIGETVVLPVAA